MKANSFFLTICIAFFISGCVAVNPIVPHYENNFTDFEASHKELVKSARIKKTFNNPFNEVWDNALYILAQHSIIINASKGSGIITFVSIDGIYFGDEFKNDNFYYWEFPFTAFIEKGERDSTVFVHPMINLYQKSDQKKSWWKTVNAGFTQKGEEFIERLSIQMTAQERWQWLRN